MKQGASINDYDWWLLATAFAICGIGVLEIWSATHASHLAGMHTHQMYWIALGVTFDVSIFSRGLPHDYGVGPICTDRDVALVSTAKGHHALRAKLHNRVVIHARK